MKLGSQSNIVPNGYFVNLGVLPDTSGRHSSYVMADVTRHHIAVACPLPVEFLRVGRLVLSISMNARYRRDNFADTCVSGGLASDPAGEKSSPR